ncbi:MAG TPA: hypothetical protein VKT80_11570 [Chloroflexota bacterium]|nr:hypothetical protein [Chloroflexota bacterium]
MPRAVRYWKIPALCVACLVGRKATIFSFNVIALTRHLRIFRGIPGRKARYNAEQVREYLRLNAADAGDPEIRRMVERLPTILRDSAVRRRYEGFQRYFDVLPRIIFLYHRGLPVADIAAQQSFLATEVGIETVLNVTAQLVADRLNQLTTIA